MDVFSVWYEATPRTASKADLAPAFNAALELAIRMCEERYAGHRHTSKYRQAADQIAEDIRGFITK